MGIYDQGLSNYQHGIDTAIQLGSQPQSLAASILGGFNQGQQQGFGNRMQSEHLGLQRDQLAEAQRRAAAQEAEARAWHQGQMQDRLLGKLSTSVIKTPEQVTAMRGALTSGGFTPEQALGFVPDLEETEPSKAAMGDWTERNLRRKAQVGMDESPYADAGPGGSAMPSAGDEESQPRRSFVPSYGSAAGQTQSKIDEKARRDAALEALSSQKNQIAQDLAEGKLSQGAARIKIAAIDSQSRRMQAVASTDRAGSYDYYVHNLPSSFGLSVGQNVRASKPWQEMYAKNLGLVKSNLTAMGDDPQSQAEAAALMTDSLFVNRNDTRLKEPAGAPSPAPRTAPTQLAPQPAAQPSGWGIKVDTFGKNQRFPKAVWMDSGPEGGAWYEKRNGSPVKVE